MSLVHESCSNPGRQAVLERSQTRTRGSPLCTLLPARGVAPGALGPRWSVDIGQVTGLWLPVQVSGGLYHPPWLLPGPAALACPHWPEVDQTRMAGTPAASPVLWVSPSSSRAAA